MRYFIGVDLGTSSVKSLLMDENGQTLGIASREYDIIKQNSSWAEQKINFLWRKTSETLSELASKFNSLKNSITAMSFSGQMHGLIALDKNFTPVRNAIIWADQRSRDSINYIERTAPDYREKIFNSISTGFLAASLIWIRDNEPENYEKIKYVMLPKDYIRFKICGEIGTEISDASGTGLFDVIKHEWAYDVIAKLNLDPKIFVPCKNSSDLAGKLNKVCARLTGLPEGISIIYGGGDTLVQAIGNGARENILISNIGTASQLLCAIHKPMHDKDFRTNTFCHVIQNQWLLMGANLTGGAALKWLKKVLGIKDYETMTNLALESEPGAKDLLFLPYLNGERTPYNDPQARAIFFGLNMNHGQKEFIRAAMEGIIFAQRETLEIFRGMGLNFSQVIVSGGGAKSAAFREIIANVLKCIVITNKISEQGCIGAAILAAVGSGTFRTIYEACDKIIKFGDSIAIPDPKKMSLYDEIFARFQKIYPANKNLFPRVPVVGQ
ncbi:MAG: xylulokinase [Synergistaceae bacterium]|nr:xylulokinase [Synergistaceae bacterium]